MVGASQACALIAVASLVALADRRRATRPATCRGGSAAGLIGMASLIDFYAALAVGTMGIVAPIGATGVIVPVAIGLGQGDRPSPIQVASAWCSPSRGWCWRAGPSCAAKGVAVPVRWSSRGCPRSASAWCCGCSPRAPSYSVAMTLLSQRGASVSAVVLVALVMRSCGGLTRRDVPSLAVIGAGDALANGLYGLADALRADQPGRGPRVALPRRHRAAGAVLPRRTPAAHPERRRGRGSRRRRA